MTDRIMKRTKKDEELPFMEYKVSGTIKLKNGNKHGLWSLAPLVPV